MSENAPTVPLSVGSIVCLTARSSAPLLAGCSVAACKLCCSTRMGCRVRFCVVDPGALILMPIFVGMLRLAPLLNGADATGCDGKLARALDLRNNPRERPCHGEAGNLGDSTPAGMNHARWIRTIHFGEFRKQRKEATDERSTGNRKIQLQRIRRFRFLGLPEASSGRLRCA